MTPVPNQQARALWRSLKALAERGSTHGERTAADIKRARLESRFDFTAPEPADENDLFAGVEITFQAGDYREIFKFTPEESTAAAFVKWTFETRFKVRGIIRSNGTGTGIWIECSDQCLPTLINLATVIRRAFLDLWREYLATPGAEPGHRRAFELGIYDGMMDDPRAPGQMLPPANVAALPGKKPPEPMPAELESFAAFNRAVRKDCDQHNGRIYFIRYFWRGKKIAQAEPDLNQSALRAAFEKLRKKYARAAKSITTAPGVTIHPYTLAAEMGKRIRLSTPIGDVIAELQDRLKN